MTTVDMEQAKADLVDLIEKAAHGEPFLISRAGNAWFKVKVELEPATDVPVDVSRRFGFLKGAGTVPDDFDTMMAEEIADMFDPED